MAETDERKRVLFRYDEKENPELDEWLNNQVNRSRSIVYALEKLIAVCGTEDDIIEHTLREATLIDKEKMVVLEKDLNLKPTEDGESE